MRLLEAAESAPVQLLPATDLGLERGSLLPELADHSTSMYIWQAKGRVLVLGSPSSIALTCLLLCRTAQRSGGRSERLSSAPQEKTVFLRTCSKACVMIATAPEPRAAAVWARMFKQCGGCKQCGVCIQFSLYLHSPPKVTMSAVSAKGCSRAAAVVLRRLCSNLATRSVLGKVCCSMIKTCAGIAVCKQAWSLFLTRLGGAGAGQPSGGACPATHCGPTTVFNSLHLTDNLMMERCTGCFGTTDQIQIHYLECHTPTDHIAYCNGCACCCCASASSIWLCTMPHNRGVSWGAAARPTFASTCSLACAEQHSMAHTQKMVRGECLVAARAVVRRYLYV